MDNYPIAFGKNIILEEVKIVPKEGLLILPNEKEDYIKARVISVGGEVQESVRTGCEVIIGKYSHIELKYNGKQFLIAKSENIYAYATE